jgi:hypothetical protein
MVPRVGGFVRVVCLLLLGPGLLGGGCEGRGTPPDVPSGEFTAHVDGSVSDTLTGAAHHRLSDDGALVGLELGAQDGPGLSIELEPQPPALRTYEVVDAELFGVDRPEQPPGAMAFLTLKTARFEAVDGTFELTYVDEEQIGATFSFQMQGEYEQGPGDAPSVAVTGALNAAAER